jgi:ubiquinone/menaquinone biosynthesis C-methylase UbiE
VAERSPQQDSLNLSVWEDPHAVRQYGRAEGFSDRGEEALCEIVRARVRNESVLDIGVGGGRTVPLLRPLAQRYVALDYAPAMVEACRQRFPEVDVSVGDARDLRRFPDESFGLVTFSFNGIDAVDHASRGSVLSEVRRVLKPSGLFWFSTLNLTGLGLRLRPWIPEWPARNQGSLRFAFQAARRLARMPRLMLNYARLLPRFSQGDGWSIDTLSAHDYKLLVHYTSLARQRQELSEHGFALELVFDSNRGQPVSWQEPLVEARGSARELLVEARGSARELLVEARGSARELLDDVFWFQILARKA